MDKTISVIVPVYNVAAYLEKSVRSILEQDYENLQILLIDDGSTDGSGAICDGFADSRVQVLHQSNAGAGAAKNAGLRLARGEYLSFVDSDDYLEPGAYRTMVDALEGLGVDAVQFGFREVFPTRTEAHSPEKALLSATEYLLRFPKDWSCALLWNKLYKRSLYDGVFFPEGHKIDDEYFTYQGFLGPGRVAVREEIVYNYRRRASSVMRAPESSERLVLDSLDAIEQRRDLVCRLRPELKPAFDENYLDALWYLTYNEGATTRTIALLKGKIRQYMRTRGNTFPPRWLWGRLLRAYFTRPEELLRQAKAQTETPEPGELFP